MSRRPSEAPASLLVTRLEQARVFPTRRDGTMRKKVGFGSDRAAQLNPMLSLVEDWMKAPGGYVEHLHQGFETVTLVFAGQVECRDARGPCEVLGEGDVQWLTTGSGVMHAELPIGEGEAHQIQLWLNQPLAGKLGAPCCRTLRAAEVPTVAFPEVTVRVIAGHFSGLEGAVVAASQARVLDVRFEPTGALELPIASGRVGYAYVAEGELQIGAHHARAGDLVHFNSKLADRLTLQAAAAAHVLVVDAPPLLEPVVVNGPFIMNTAAQIQQAYGAFRDGTFGLGPIADGPPQQPLHPAAQAPAPGLMQSVEGRSVEMTVDVVSERGTHGGR